MSVEGIIGATIGYFIGGPTGAKYGYAIGSAIDGATQSGPDIQGPRLSDLKVQSSAYGAPIPIIYGKARVSGNVIWAKPIRERKIEEDSGGKGGGGQTTTTYEYYGTFAVALCDNEIAGVRRIWADSKLIYNLSNAASLETIQASNRNAKSITIYYGTEAQEPDSLIQADKGAANTQAYRGTAYIVFDDLLLEKYGNRIPNITVEVLTAGGNAIRKIDSYSTPPMFANSNISMPYVDTINGISHIFAGQWDSSLSTSQVKYYKSYSNGLLEEQSTFTLGSSGFNLMIHGYSDTPVFVSGRSVNFFRDRVRVGKYDNGTLSILSYSASDTLGIQTPISSGNSVFCYSDKKIYLLVNVSGTKYLLKSTDEAGFSSTSSNEYAQFQLIQSSSDLLSSNTHTFVVSNNVIYVLNSDNTIDKFDENGVFIESISFTPSPSITYSVVGEPKPVIRVEDDVIWLVTDARLYKVTGGVCEYVGALSTTAYGNYGGTEVMDGAAYLLRSESLIAPFSANFDSYQIESVSAGTVALSDIVSDIDARTGLDPSEYDASALTDTVEGYIVTRPMPARTAIEPLQQAFLFDAAEIDNVLTFVKRGGSVVTTIPEIDLGAAEYGQSTELYTHQRQQDSELPSQVVVDYIDFEKQYEVGSQRANRINSNFNNVVKINMSIAMSADYAKEIAHVLLYNAHVARDSFKISVTGEYIDLNPTDVIQFTVDGETRKVRITKISYGDSLEIDCVADDATIYSATSVAGDSEDNEQTVGLDGPTKMYLLDIPLLRNQDNDAGMYVAASGYFSAWTGAQIFKSLDGGTSYSPVNDVVTGSVMGVSTTVLADANHTVFDYTSTVTVSLTSGTLSSSTESAVIQGANFAILGLEVIQFVNATDNGDGTYTLDTLLRGRRGTDWATGTHVANEQFSLLRENVLERVGAVVNTERYYKPVTFGTSLAETTAQVKTNTGVNQKPFSPKYIAGSRDGSNNLSITWVRRSRYIGTPLWNPPVFEESESYRVEILDAPDGNIINTYSSSSQSYAYTATQQTNDGLTPGNTVYVNIYQVGAVNGYGTQATL